mmetsp:Transcript_11709/g.38472  ORF Transcript_11709/g.38472 Transcript_11709/m.38472 type:complete len:543 (-) Transcript_11709:1852-3480(-)
MYSGVLLPFAGASLAELFCGARLCSCRCSALVVPPPPLGIVVPRPPLLLLLLRSRSVLCRRCRRHSRTRPCDSIRRFSRDMVARRLLRARGFRPLAPEVRQELELARLVAAALGDEEGEDELVELRPARRFPRVENLKSGVDAPLSEGAFDERFVRGGVVVLFVPALVVVATAADSATAAASELEGGSSPEQTERAVELSRTYARGDEYAEQTLLEFLRVRFLLLLFLLLCPRLSFSFSCSCTCHTYGPSAYALLNVVTAEAVAAAEGAEAAPIAGASKRDRVCGRRVRASLLLLLLPLLLLHLIISEAFGVDGERLFELARSAERLRERRRGCERNLHAILLRLAVHLRSHPHEALARAREHERGVRADAAAEPRARGVREPLEVDCALGVVKLAERAHARVERVAVERRLVLCHSLDFAEHLVEVARRGARLEQEVVGVVGGGDAARGHVAEEGERTWGVAEVLARVQEAPVRHHRRLEPFVQDALVHREHRLQLFGRRRPNAAAAALDASVHHRGVRHHRRLVTTPAHELEEVVHALDV